MFKSWDKIKVEHQKLNILIKEQDQIETEHFKEWNSKRAPLKREEQRLRNQLANCTERERKIIETRIDTIVDELKPIDETLVILDKKNRELINEIYDYMKANFTKQEKRKARKNGWQI